MLLDLILLYEFLMHRVELKDIQGRKIVMVMDEFLMHRVELKEKNLTSEDGWSVVPNAPCGVESSYAVSLEASFAIAFLMHRVELKARF